jgi:voltage-gated potassium channel
VPITIAVRTPHYRLPPAPCVRPRFTLVRAAAALGGVVGAGTVGIMLVEGWNLPQALFFTVTTLTTVGYGDYGLSEAGKYVALAMMVGGLSVVTYSAGKLLPSLFNPGFVWERKMNHRIVRLKDHFIVCGLGRIGQSVCQHLAREGVPFIGIDPNVDAVTTLIEADHLAIVGDATDDEVLEEVGVRRAKAIACITGSDSENIAITLGAREMNPALFIVSRTEQEDAIRKMQRAGATRVISPVRSGGFSIVNAILKPNLAEFIDLSHDRAESFELAEITIQPGSALDGSTIRSQGTTHRGLLVVALKRPETAMRLRPDPDEPIRSDDLLIVAGDQLSIDALRRQASDGSIAA